MALVLAAHALTGCSSPENPPGAERVAPSFGGWHRQASLVCQAAYDEVEELESQMIVPPTLESTTQLLDRVRVVAARQIAQLHELGHPADRAEEVDELLDALRQQAAELDALIKVGETGDVELFNETMTSDSIAEVSELLDVAAISLGLPQCGTDDGDG